MTCEHIANELPLYLYGELTQEEEEKVEQHLNGCAGCAGELAKARRFGNALTAWETPLPDDLLQRSRVDLARAIRLETAGASESRGSLTGSWMGRLREFMNMGVGLRVPAGALALVAVGFFAAKLTPWNPAGAGSTQQAGFINVRSVEPDSQGRVRIAFDNVSPASIAGSVDDPKIKELLLAAVHDQANDGLRVQSAGVMKDHAGDVDLRNALLNAVQHDKNVGVRLEVIKGLEQFASDPAVRKALIETLLHDDNAGVRVKVIDLLTAHTDDSLVGPLQDAMRKENNSYVRLSIEKSLRAKNASLGTF